MLKVLTRRRRRRRRRGEKPVPTSLSLLGRLVPVRVGQLCGSAPALLQVAGRATSRSRGATSRGAGEPHTGEQGSTWEWAADNLTL